MLGRCARLKARPCLIIPGAAAAEQLISCQLSSRLSSSRHSRRAPRADRRGRRSSSRAAASASLPRGLRTVPAFSACFLRWARILRFCWAGNRSKDGSPSPPLPSDSSPSSSAPPRSAIPPRSRGASFAESLRTTRCHPSRDASFEFELDASCAKSVYYSVPEMSSDRTNTYNTIG